MHFEQVETADEAGRLEWGMEGAPRGMETTLHTYLAYLAWSHYSRLLIISGKSLK